MLDRYQVKTDKASGIVDDQNDGCDEHDEPTYIVDLIKRVTTVGVETVRIVERYGRTRQPCHVAQLGSRWRISHPR